MPQRKYMTHEELSAIVHYSPISLVVLDRHRNLRRVNKMAEALLGLNPLYCTGQSFLSWIPEASEASWNTVLHSAAEGAWAQSSGNAPWTCPTSTRLPLHTRQTAETTPGKRFWADVSVAVVFETSSSALHEGEYVITLLPTMDAAYKLRSDEEKGEYSIEPQRRGSLVEDAVLKQLAQDRTNAPDTSDDVKSVGLETAADTEDINPFVSPLLESVIHNFDFPIICMSKDGRTIIRNSAMDDLLFSIAGPDRGANTERPWGEAGAAQASEDDAPRDVNVSWLFSAFKLWDSSFTERMPESAYPLYRAAILGERFKHGRFGCITSTGGKRLLDTEGWPMLSEEGSGEFIGGMIVIKDVTRASNREAAHSQQQQAPTWKDTISSSINAGLSPTEEQTGHSYASYYESLCQELPDIAWIARGDGYLEWYSDRWYEYTGQSPAEALGAGWTSCIHREDFPAVSASWSRALHTATPYEVQERIRRFDGEYRWFLCRAQPTKSENGVVDKWVGYLTDVHNTVDSMAANREARENLSEAVRVADITLWSIDTNGTFTLAEGNLSGVDPNTSNSSLGSTSSEDGRNDQRDTLVRNLPPAQAPIVGKNIYTEWGETTRKAIERALKGELVTEETRIKGRTYRTLYKTRRARITTPASFLLSERLNPEDAMIIGVTGMSMDITGRLEMEKKMEEGIREVARAEAAEAAAMEASRMKSQFLAVISHEIRTPLNGVVGLSELLLDIEALPTEAQDLVNSILRSAGALLTVINDVLDFSKVEAGKLDIVSLPFSLKLTCEDSMRDFRRLMAQKGLTLDQDINLPDGMVMGDAGRITQVLNNLLNNAIKFTESGAVALSARKTGESMYTFSISDSGCGIPRDKVGLLFQPFRQADPSTSRRYGGSGLGLAICKSLIELMNGEISLRTVEGKGTTVTFRIPLVDAEPALRTPTEELRAFTLQQQQDRAASNSPNSSALAHLVPGDERRVSFAMVNGADSSGLSLGRSSVVDSTAAPAPDEKDGRPRILLAEDNPINSQIAIKTLTKLGYDVDHVENGELVLLALERQSYDLVLMDCMMPTMDGYTATRKMRASNSILMKTIPVIALTAAAIQGQRTCLSAGMTDYLSKPVRRATLGAMLVKWLGRKHVMQPGADDDEELDSNGDGDVGKRILCETHSDSLSTAPTVIVSTGNGGAPGSQSLHFERRGSLPSSTITTMTTSTPSAATTVITPAPSMM